MKLCSSSSSTALVDLDVLLFQVNITEKVNEFSIELQKLHACTKHGSPWCWRSQPDDRHVPLNMAQIRSWANAMVCAVCLK